MMFTKHRCIRENADGTQGIDTLRSFRLEYDHFDIGAASVDRKAPRKHAVILITIDVLEKQTERRIDVAASIRDVSRRS